MSVIKMHSIIVPKSTYLNVNHAKQNIILILQSGLTKLFSFVLSSEKRSLRKKHVARIFDGRSSQNLKA